MSALSVLLIHTVPGRCRLRIPGLGQDARIQQCIENGLAAHPQVIGIRFNLGCDSLVVQHRDSTDRIVAELRGLIGRRARKPVPRPVAERTPDQARRAGPPLEPSSHAPFRWASGALALASVPSMAPVAWFPLLVCGMPIWKRALDTLVQERRLNVDFLDGLALGMALARGQVGTGALMAWMVHLGDVIRDRTALRSRRRIRALLDFQSVTARKLEVDGSVRIVRAEDLHPGQQALLLAGDVVPADGAVHAGVGAVDQRNITGESVPATRRTGDPLYAGSSVVEGRLTMLVRQAGQDTAAARIVQMLESAPVGETRMQNYAEKFADRLVAPLLGMNTALLAVTANLDRFMSMSIVDYGTGIRVAAPTSVLASMTRAAHEGILIKSGAHVERLATLHGMAFDKTGTLTYGRLAILDVRTFTTGLGIEAVVQLAAAIEAPLRHPVARAVVRHATRALGLALPRSEDVDFTIGLGASGRVGDRHVRVGSERYMRQCSVGMGSAAVYMDAVEREGLAALLVAVDGTLAGVFAYADELRPEAPAVVAALRKRSVREIVMLTGDRGGIARQVAHKLGIDRFFAEVLPAEKAQIVESLRNGSGRNFAMVGDGVNDSPALARADVGIALVEGADIAREAADVVLMEGGLFRIVDAIDISRGAMSLVRQNYALIATCNTAALMLALPAGWVSPAVVTLLSNGSAIAATFNAMRPLLVTRRRPGRRRTQRAG